MGAEKRAREWAPKAITVQCKIFKWLRLVCLCTAIARLARGLRTKQSSAGARTFLSAGRCGRNWRTKMSSLLRLRLCRAVAIASLRFLGTRPECKDTPVLGSFRCDNRWSKRYTCGSYPPDTVRSPSIPPRLGVAGWGEYSQY